MIKFTRWFSGFLSFSIFLSVFALNSCNSEDYTPKPKAYFRIDFPEKKYIKFETDCPFSFEYPFESILVKNKKGTNCWYDLHYPQYRCSVHFTYNKIRPEDIEKFTNDAHTLVMKHIVKASFIDEKLFVNDSANVYGLAYDLKGNTASNFQFFLSDSSNHFFRGAMYFHMAPNADSLELVSEFIKADIEHLMETFQWK